MSHERLNNRLLEFAGILPANPKLVNELIVPPKNANGSDKALVGQYNNPGTVDESDAERDNYAVRVIIEKIQKLDEVQQCKLLWQWIQEKHITFKQFCLLIRYFKNGEI